MQLSGLEDSTLAYLIGGSGLKEVLCEMYAPNSVDHMLSGHAYSRAIRGHKLVQAALSAIIFESVSVAEEESQFCAGLFDCLDDAEDSSRN